MGKIPHPKKDREKEGGVEAENIRGPRKEKSGLLLGVHQRKGLCGPISQKFWRGDSHQPCVNDGEGARVLVSNTFGPPG